MINKVVKHIINQLHTAHCLLLTAYCKLQTAHCTLHTAKLLTVLSLLLILFITPVNAQNFPVQVIPQAIPPAPIHFSDYADASTVSSPLRVQIILNDLEIANREVRLKAYFQGNNITFQSNDIVVGADPLFLEGGVPLILTNVELAPYFQFQNITGISPNVYGQTIPEGAYQFCFEVYDVLSGNRLSNKSCATTVVFQNEPPFLVMPRNKTNIEEINPQNIVFQWTPRSINVTNVEYELSLVEIWDTQIDPQAAFLSSPPVFQTTTTATTYVYGPADPLLLSGKNYAWRVQARAKQGIEEIGLFKNEGYSEIFSFSYAGSCDLPLSLNHEVKGSTNANIFWDDLTTDIPEYTVRYRKKGNDNEWFISKTTTNQVTLWDLKAGTTYEYQIQKKCTVTGSDWSLTKEFTTFIADNEASVYECGINPDFTLTNKEPLANLSSGEKFTAGDFPINVLEVSGSNGRFTGTGYVTIPYLNSIRVGVKFTNVLINTDQKLAEGTVITTYDPSLKNILNIDEAVETVGNAVEAVGEFFEGDNDLDEMRVNFSIPKDKVNDYITVEDGIVTITNPENGASISEPLGDDKVVVDKDGQVYHIDAEGNITEGGTIDAGGAVNTGNVEGVANNGELESLTAEGILVTFNTPGTFGFDKMPSNANDKLKKEYEIIKDADGNDYVLPHHAVKKGEDAKITATIIIKNNAYIADSVVFKTKQGEKIPATFSGNTATLSIRGTYTFESETIYAVVPDKEDSTKQHTAGAFTLWHLTERAVKVALVSVNNASLGNIEETVTNIFKQGVAKIDFQETLALSFDKDNLGTNGLDVGESAWAAAYNDEQKQLVNAVKKLPGYKNDTYYILVFGDITPSRSIAGFMPLQRQMGFVFSGTGDEEGKGGDKGKVLAHEIGHGIFALQHPFAQYDMPERSTDWLMDYNGGINLPHMHWAQIHNPDLKFYIFQDEEDGEHSSYEYIVGYNVVPGLFSQHIKNNDKLGISFVSATGKIITLPNDVKDVTFTSKGALFGFTINENNKEERYIGAVRKAGTSEENFAGYLKNFSNQSTAKWEDRVYKDYVSKNLPKQTLVYFGKLNNSPCGINLYSKTYPNNAKDTWNSGGDKNPLNNIDLTANLNPINDEIITSNGACNSCEGGQIFIDKYKDISDVATQEVIIDIAHLICNSPSDTLFIKEIEQKGIEQLFGWQQTEYFEGNWDRSKAAFEKFRDSYDNYVDYYFAAKAYINTATDRKAIMQIAYNLSEEQLALLTVPERLVMLRLMATGPMLGYWTSSNYNIEALALKIIRSITPENSEAFINGLTDATYNIDGKPLYKALFEGIDDVLEGDNFTQFILHLTDLTLERNHIGKENAYDISTIEAFSNGRFFWDVQNEQFLWLFNMVRDNSKLIVNEVNNGDLSLKQCCINEKIYSTGYYGNSTSTVCMEYAIDTTLKPFDLVSIQIFKDISFVGTEGDCNSKEAVVCGQEALVPAAFLLFLDGKKKNAITQNIVTNTLTAASIYFSGAEILAAKGALTWATLPAYADLFVTFTDPYFSSPGFREDASGFIQARFGTTKEEANELANLLQTSWTIGSTVMTIDTAKKLPDPNEHIKALATYKALVKKIGTEDATKLLSKDKKLAEKTASGFKNIEEDIIKLGKSDELAEETTKAETRLQGIIGKKVFKSKAGKILVKKDNLLDIESISGEFKSFTYKIGDDSNPITKQNRAGTFWNLGSNSSISHTQYVSADGNFYVKLVPDKNDGRLLFYDIEQGKFLGWGILPTKNDELINPLKDPSDYETLIQDLKLIHGLEKNTTSFDFGPKGILVRYVDKLNAYLGSYNPSRTAGAANELGTGDVLDRLTMYKNYRFADKNAADFEPGSISMLNMPDVMASTPNTENFFDDFNAEYLDFLIVNKDKTEIIFTTNPIHQDLFKAWDSSKNNYQRNSNLLFEPSGFAKEIKYLRDRGVKIVKFKDGSNLNLDEVDLSEMDWSKWKY
ncbi:fibronectin type III domain-containing protein [Maribacter sp. ANRC-HE7]|uniref:Fibronectin type III domain-containing protein n=1 Tax=Maribacter aquimaris TaxID=2737171 RepID=A0ABR7UWR7_9FLAO|nr:fibronectin type III domain-containing protein [Maribacter aquimaris]MBD0776984.1 fibronectin type III domain-containing protein [Maribacter aquimaris]